jgi:hypothetical protein
LLQSAASGWVPKRHPAASSRSAAFGSFSTLSTSTTTISTIAVMPGNRTLPGLGSDNGLLGEFHLGLGCTQARGG